MQRIAAALRCLIDSMVFDAVAAEPTLLAEVGRLTDGRALELLAALDTMREVGAVPERARRRALQRVRVLVVPPPDAADPAVRATLTRLAGSRGVSVEDARIAATAAVLAVPLVTEDRDLREAAAAHLPGMPVWSIDGELLPRLAALGAQHPPRTDGRLRRRRG